MNIKIYCPKNKKVIDMNKCKVCKYFAFREISEQIVGCYYNIRLNNEHTN